MPAENLFLNRRLLPQFPLNLLPLSGGGTTCDILLEGLSPRPTLFVIMLFASCVAKDGPGGLFGGSGGKIPSIKTFGAMFWYVICEIGFFFFLLLRGFFVVDTVVVVVVAVVVVVVVLVVVIGILGIIMCAGGYCTGWLC